MRDALKAASSPGLMIAAVLCLLLALLAGAATSQWWLALLPLGALWVALSVRRPWLAVLLLCWFVPVESMFQLRGWSITVAKPIGMVAMFAWLMNVFITRSRIRFPPLAVVTTAYMAWGLTSMGWSLSPTLSWNTLKMMVSLFGMFVLLANVVNEKKKADWVVLSFLAGTAFLCWALYRELGNQFTYIVSWQNSRRFKHGSADPNDHARVLAIGMICLSYLWFRYKQPFLRLLMLAWGAVLGFFILMLASRATWISLVLAGFVYSVYSPDWKRRLPAIAGGFAALVMVVAVAAMTGRLDDRVASRIEMMGEGESEATAGRTDVWRVGLRMYQEHPLRGLGLRNFKLHYDYYNTETPRAGKTKDGMGPHNIYVEALVDLGPIGLTLVLLMFWVLWVEIRKKERTELSAITVALLAFLFISAGATHQLVRKYHWFGLSLVYLVASQLPARRRGEQEEILTASLRGLRTGPQAAPSAADAAAPAAALVAPEPSRARVRTAQQGDPSVKGPALPLERRPQRRLRRLPHRREAERSAREGGPERAARGLRGAHEKPRRGERAHGERDAATQRAAVQARREERYRRARDGRALRPWGELLEREG